MYFVDQDYWRLIIASPSVSREGRASMYGRLGAILRTLPLSGLRLEDTSLFEPDSPQFRDLLSAAEGSRFLAAPSSWSRLEDAVIYRWTDAAVIGELKPEISAARLAQLWDAERERTNSPQLLFTVEKGRVTIRFHPRHGTLVGIEKIKRPFALALHRPDAFPECKLTWLA